MKPKQNYSDQPEKDCLFTPYYAIEPLLLYLPKDNIIWECAAGNCDLVEALDCNDYRTVASDILWSSEYDFFTYKPTRFDTIITNPPYSIKYDFIERCYQLEKPFALLLPLETLGAAKCQVLIKRYGFEVMFLDKRVDFWTPKLEWRSSAQFPVMWLCHNILPQQVMFGNLNKQRADKGVRYAYSQR